MDRCHTFRSRKRYEFDMHRMVHVPCRVLFREFRRNGSRGGEICNPPLPTAYNLPPTTYRLQPTAYNLPPTAYRPQPTAYPLAPSAAARLRAALRRAAPDPCPRCATARTAGRSTARPPPPLPTPPPRARVP